MHYWSQQQVTTLNLWQEVTTTLLLQLEEGKIPPGPVTAQPMGDGHSSANEKSLYFQLSVSSSGLTLPLQQLLPRPSKSILILYFPVFAGIHCMPPNAILCSQISPFSWRNIWLFICWGQQSPSLLLTEQAWACSPKLFPYPNGSNGRKDRVLAGNQWHT